jgi:transglutaminase-like putative cysteine protease
MASSTAPTIAAARPRAGLCYQRLTIDGPNPPHCLHGYVALWLPTHGWYATDARGNKPGVAAHFDPPHEQLAFPLVHAGERDFALILAKPLPVVVDCLRTHATWDAVLAHLPDAQSLSP